MLSVPAVSSVKRYHAYQAAFSRRTTVRQIEQFLCGRIGVKNEDLRLWSFRDEVRYWTNDIFSTELTQAIRFAIQSFNFIDTFLVIDFGDLCDFAGVDVLVRGRWSNPRGHRLPG